MASRIDALIKRTQATLSRLTPAEAHAAQARGALQRRNSGPARATSHARLLSTAPSWSGGSTRRARIAFLKPMKVGPSSYFVDKATVPHSQRRPFDYLALTRPT